jgi:2-oxoisovalerate dehydrogenase E2 component (dihydrolipoyl transacylase)
LANRADESLRAELTSPTPGVVHKLNVEEGQIVRVGSTLCEIRTDDEGGEAVEEESPVVQEPEEEVHEVQQRKEEPVPEPQSSRAEPEESVKRQQQPSPSPTPSARHNVEETRLNDDSSQYSTGVSFSGEASILPSAAPAPRAATFAGPVPERREGEFNERRKVILSSPAVRNLAGRLGVNLQDVVGSGPNGRITKDDITASSQSSGARSTPLPTMSAPRVTGDRAKMPESTRVEFGRIRKMMWKALSPQGSVPHFG